MCALGLQPRSSTAGVLINCACVCVCGCSCALRTTAALQDREGEREYAARQNIYDAPEHKGEAQITDGSNCEVSPGCPESSALPVEFSYNVLLNVHIFEALQNRDALFHTQRDKTSVTKKLQKNVCVSIVILLNVVKKNKRELNGRCQ